MFRPSVRNSKPQVAQILGRRTSYEAFTSSNVDTEGQTRTAHKAFYVLQVNLGIKAIYTAHLPYVCDL